MSGMYTNSDKTDDGAARDSTNHAAQAETPITTAFADDLSKRCRSMASLVTEDRFRYYNCTLTTESEHAVRCVMEQSVMPGEDLWRESRHSAWAHVVCASKEIAH